MKEFTVIRNAEEGIRKASGGGGRGSVETTYEDLHEKLGRPTKMGSPDNKTRVLWVLEYGDGIVTIYDYKCSLPIEKVRCWSLGGNLTEKQTVARVCFALNAPTRTTKQRAEDYAQFLKDNNLELRFHKVT